MAYFTVLIPAYQPDEKLLALLHELAETAHFSVVVVDDGSGEPFHPIFAQAEQIPGCHVISYATNQGKGHALKVGFLYCAQTYGGDPGFAGVVTADADGQHLREDILRVGNALSPEGTELILGVRSFQNKIPLRSKFGNNLTIFTYRLVSGIRVSDTQTGLRGIPAASLEAMGSLEGERYEYEMQMLLHVKQMGLTVREIPIKTVYIDDNSSSHFDPLKDSVRIYKVILRKAYLLKYICSSVAAFCVDYLTYAVLFSTGLLSSVNAQIPARILSSVFNFIVNQRLVFHRGGTGAGKTALQALQYFALVLVNLFLIARPLNALLLSWGLSGYLSQPIANAVQFAVSYVVQRWWIFATKQTSKTKTDG